MKDSRKSKYNFILKVLGIAVILTISSVIMFKFNTLAITGTKIEGYVWVDLDNNGKMDNGEIGKEGVTVVLCDENGNEITDDGATATTGADGKYVIQIDRSISKYKIKIKDNVNKIYKISTIGGQSSDIDKNINLAYAYPTYEEDNINKITDLITERSNGATVEYKLQYDENYKNSQSQFKEHNALSDLLGSLDDGVQNSENRFFIGIIDNNIKGVFTKLGASLEKKEKKLIIVIKKDLEQHRKEEIYNTYGSTAVIIEETDGVDYTEEVKKVILAYYGITDNETQENTELNYSNVNDDNITDVIEGEVQEVNISVNESQGDPGGTSGGVFGKTSINVGVAGGGECTIKGNVREYIDDATSNNIEGVKVELLDENENKIQLNDIYGTPIDAVYSDKDGNYEIQGVDTASVVLNDDGTISTTNKKYTVQFTYGTEEQLKINPKYNGQDYQSKKDEGATTVITTGGGNTDQSEEIDDLQPPEVEEGEKVDIYILLDYSGSMTLSVDLLKQNLYSVSNKVFDIFGDNARIGLIAFGGYNINSGQQNEVTKLIPLSNEKDYRNSIEGSIGYIVAAGDNYNGTAIAVAKDSLLKEGRNDSQKYIIPIGDGISEMISTKEAYEDAKGAGINMFSIITGDPIGIKRFWYIIESGLAGTDWYYTPELHQGELFGKVISQYVSGNRDFVNNRDDLTEDGTTWGNIGTAIKYSRANASIAEDYPIRRSNVNSYTATIGYDLRKQIKKCF